jgi:hypothetical protein
MAAQPSSTWAPEGAESGRVRHWMDTLELGSRPCFTLGLVEFGQFSSQGETVSGREAPRLIHSRNTH